jgi:putative endonuclease
MIAYLKRLFREEKSDGNQDKGLQGERRAAQFLKKQGYKILVERYRCHYGEIDLVARDKDTLVFIEVKTRASEEFGDPSLAVTDEKQIHISRVALDYLRRLKNPEVPVRFDVVEVLPNGCNLIRDAFSLSEPYLY